MKRRIPKSKRRHPITVEAIEAYKARDFSALHRALGLKPWEMSPLPNHPLGCDPDWEMPASANNLFALSFPQALELQQRLEEACQ
ncbi:MULTISPECIES: hypothetical protein [Mesorhizobium]|uniref:hypothetical protein n=1 Tax=Mesorhizobium TaxID=68287 RepID=UPI0003CE9BB2|nr:MULTISPECIES: hypothetical protein [Mesorhizobium]ESY70005.1 hypothetical protein X742_05695 [Mesorhizobium sp. LNHC232B00]WJI40290.1 hypothetical protein NL534_08630 [Mesorhizobium opportunistum]